jgi:hypothetical protein
MLTNYYDVICVNKLNVRVVIRSQQELTSREFPMKALTKLQIERTLKDDEFNPLDESLSPEKWAEKRNAQISQRGQSPPNTSALLWLENDEEFELELRRVWKERIEAPAMDTMLALVNMGDSAKDVQAFRLVVQPQYDIARENDDKLLALRDELRLFWNEVSKETRQSAREFGNNEKVAIALHSWWQAYDITSDGWKIFWGSGAFVPTQKNFRGTIARTLLGKRRYLAICSNPNCRRYFIGRRTDNKYCGGEDCDRFANNFRQKHFQRKHGRKSVRSSTRRKPNG